MMEPSLSCTRLMDLNFRKMRNINCGILGHVDSGKTTLSKCLSQIGSTNSFDKNPQSKERGITLDLGFSSFCPRDDVRVTLVDCPGHGSLPSGYKIVSRINFYHTFTFHFIIPKKDKNCDWRRIDY